MCTANVLCLYLVLTAHVTLYFKFICPLRPLALIKQFFSQTSPKKCYNITEQIFFDFCRILYLKNIAERVLLRADAGKYQKWPVSCKILKILIFCPNYLYSKLLSKILFIGSSSFSEIEQSLKIAIRRLSALIEIWQNL